MLSKYARLRHCIGCLGLLVGFRYWRMQNRAIADPDIVLVWCDRWRRAADWADEKQDYLMSGCLRGMIEDCEHIRSLSKFKR